MIPERLADLHARYDGLSPDAYAPDHPATHVLELLAYLADLKHSLSGAGECIDAYVTALAQSETLVRQLRREIVDADGSATAAEIERDVARAERDRAREIARRAYRHWLTPRVRSLTEENAEFSAATAITLGTDALPGWLTVDEP